MWQQKVVQKIKTHILCSAIFIFENRKVYEIMWKNMVEPDTTDTNTYDAGLCMLDN
jgi:hypothetical protein